MSCAHRIRREPRRRPEEPNLKVALFIIDREAGKIMHLVASAVCLSVCFSDGHHYLVPLSINHPLMSPIIH